MPRPRREIDLVATFRGARVLTLDDLGDRLSISRSTVLRRLTEHGYVTSYNHSGRFLTIEEVAEFDSRGLWAFKTARFSRYGTLKRTVEHFVRSSESGMTHEELSALLGVRVHNALLELFEEGVVGKEHLGPTFVYLSPQVRTRRGQIRVRSASLGERENPRPTNRQIIESLLELVRNPRATRTEIVAHCQQVGVPISLAVVDAVFARYDLDKKRAP